jgi:hypothetical protein
MAGINLYNLPQIVQLMIPTPNGATMITSFHHTRSDFKIFWNVDNPIDFYIRNYDRKIVLIADGETYAMIISHPKTGVVFLQRDFTVVDAPTGHLRLTITASESVNYPIGNLVYSVTKTANGSTTLLFTDRDHGPQSGIEVKYGPVMPAPAPYVILGESFATVDKGLRVGPFKGPATVGYGASTMSFEIDGTSLTGQFIFEGTKSINVPTSAMSWTPVNTTTVTLLSGTQTVTLDGSNTWIRIHWIPASGTLNKISIS